MHCWNERAAKQQPDRIDWSDHCMICDKTHNRIPLEVERSILRRKKLKEKGVWGEYDTVAIHCAMSLQNSHVVLSIRTINLPLKRYNRFDMRY
jgi:hypothetical protein